MNLSEESRRLLQQAANAWHWPEPKENQNRQEPEKATFKMMTMETPKAKADALAALLDKIAELESRRPPSQSEVRQEVERINFTRTKTAKELAFSSRYPNNSNETRRLREQLERANALPMPTFNVAARRAWAIEMVGLKPRIQAAFQDTNEQFEELTEGRLRGGLSLAEGKKLVEMEQQREALGQASHQIAILNIELETLAPRRVISAAADIERTLHALVGFGVCGALINDVRGRLEAKLNQLRAALQRASWDELNGLDVAI